MELCLQLKKFINKKIFLGDFNKFKEIIIYFDSVFRGISQVMFANNPLSGLIITIGLFIGNWELSFYGFLGTCVSTLTAILFGFNSNSIRSGLFGYNGCLTGMGIAYFSFDHSPQMIVPVVLMCIFSSIFSMAIGKNSCGKFQISPFTFSFQICVWIWLLASLKSRYFFINGNILSPTLLTTLIDKPNLLNITYQKYSVEQLFRGFFTSISQVYFIDNPYTGAIILIGVCFCSRILSFFALFGSITGQLTAAYMFGLSPQSINAGLWGYNTVLTCQALGGMFFVLHGYSIWLYTFYGSIMTILVQIAFSSFLNPIGMPTLTFPFTFICWIFYLIGGTKHIIAVKITGVSIPEDHYHRYKLSCLIENQSKYLNYLKYFSSSKINEDIRWEELIQIQKSFLPILISSYIYQNNFKKLKKLIKQYQNLNLNFLDQNLRNPLHISASVGNYQITKWLIENVKNLNINAVDKFGNAPLYDALWNGHIHLLPLIFKHGGRFSSTKSRELAFYLNGFIYEKSFYCIQLLISCGFNPNGSDFDGRNALHIAVITNQFDIVCFLIEQYPIWLDIKDYFQLTAIDYALKFSYLDIANYLINHYKNNSIPFNLSINYLENLEMLIPNISIEEEEKKVLIDKNSNEYLFPILFNMIAIQEDKKLIKQFLNDNQNFNVLETVDYDFRSTAHLAATQGQLEIIEFFINIMFKR